jgi:hypothetical protein
MTAVEFRELVYSTYGGIAKTPHNVQDALAQLDRESHTKLQRPEKVWYDLLALKTRKPTQGVWSAAK